VESAADQTFIDTLEKEGEAALRLHFERGIYPDGHPRRRLVLEWLKKKEIERNVLSFDFSKRAADAAERSARAAERAERWALWAVMIGLFAVSITVFLWYRST